MDARGVASSARVSSAASLKHLALLVHDIRRARRFYETYFGFDTEAAWHGEVLFIRNPDGFDLALMRGQHPPNPGAFHHFGFLMTSAADVDALKQRLVSAGVPILEDVHEPDLVSFKCVDPDGYTVEVYSELTGA
jgi:catechol 2,3-dioxygenase-like lactoylglutathione lyase family enzyme